MAYVVCYPPPALPSRRRWHPVYAIDRETGRSRRENENGVTYEEWFAYANANNCIWRARNALWERNAAACRTVRDAGGEPGWHLRDREWVPDRVLRKAWRDGVDPGDIVVEMSRILREEESE